MLWVLGWALEVWGVFIGVARSLWLRWRVDSSRTGGRLVVVGGGFSGAVVSKLAERSFTSVTLVSASAFWEFTPSVPSVLRDFERASHIQVDHASCLGPSTTLVLGHVREVDMASKCVLVDQNQQGDYKRIAFDQLVLCTGTNYAMPFRECKGQQSVVLASRAQHLLDAGKRIQSARRILIVGGGIVGGKRDSCLSMRVVEVRATHRSGTRGGTCVYGARAAPAALSHAGPFGPVFDEPQSWHSRTRTESLFAVAPRPWRAGAS